MAPTASKKAYNGSAKDSSSTHKHRHKYSHSSKSSQEPVDKYVKDERDHRSYAVTEYDPYQQEARKEREDRIRDVVERRYGS
jgi:hypothetical protein